MMAFHTGREPGSERQPQPDLEQAGPEQVVEYYRGDPLFSDITERLDWADGTDHELGPHEELVVTLEAYSTRLKDARQYLEALSDGIGYPNHASLLPIRKFLDSLAKARGNEVKMSVVNAELAGREQAVRKAQRDAAAMVGEFNAE